MYFETKFRRYFEVMPWLIHYMSLLFPLGMCMVTVVETEKKVEIYWNSSNPLFSSQDRYLSVEPNTKLTFICPQYSIFTPPTQMEYYVVYMVPELYYNRCIIEEVHPPNVRLIVNCSDPTADPPISFSIWVKQFQSIPGMPDFTFLKRYYFTTTSTGTLPGINNQVNGACKMKNMTMVLEMCCNTTTTATSKQTTPIPPSTQSPTTKRPVTEKPTTLPPTSMPTTTTTTTSTTSATIKTIRTTKPDFPKPDTDIVINATDENANTALIDISAARTLDTSWLVLILTILCQLLVLLHR